jgi:hypothetical protein
MTEFEKFIEAVQKGDIESARAALSKNASFINERDDLGATALHYATFGGHHAIVQLLLDSGADINATDGKFGATPAGWAIEYLREQNGFLGIELSDFAYAIQQGDAKWVQRFLQRFPSLRKASDMQGKSFNELAQQSGNAEIISLF